MTIGNDAAAQEARCAGWRPLTFSAKGDTKTTINEIRTHNAVGQEKRCWE